MIKKSSIALTLLSLMMALIMPISLSSCQNDAADKSDEQGNAANSSIIIEGDVQNGFIRVNEPSGDTELNADPVSSGFEGMSLTDFIAQANPSGTPKDIYFTSADGFIARVKFEDADEIFVIHNEEKGFCVIAPKHPISAQGQELHRVVVVSDGSQVGLNIIRKDGSNTLIPKGQILISPLTTSMWFRGESEMAKEDSNFSSSVYTRELSATLGVLYDEYKGEPIVIATQDGGKFLSDGTGRIIIGETEFDYEDEHGNRYEKIKEIHLR